MPKPRPDCVMPIATDRGSKQSVRDSKLFEQVLAGTPADEIQSDLNRLAATERQALLCTVCFILEEVEMNCRERADEIRKLVQNNCPQYSAGQALCACTSGE